MSDQTYPRTGEPAFRRAVARIDDSAVVAGNIPGHRARHLIDGREAAFTDPFLVRRARRKRHGAILSIAHDRLRDWRAPEAWNMRLARGIATVLGVVAPRRTA
jgi:hypothetical protein